MSRKTRVPLPLTVGVEATSWPSVAFEDLDWVLPATVEVSNTQRRKLSGPYRAAITPAIAGLPVSVDRGVAEGAEEAAFAMVRFDAELGSRVMPFASVLLRSESAASSRIEQLTATAKAIALAELGDDSKRNASMIVSNVRAMEAAIELADDLDGAAILAMHQALLVDEHPQWVGRWRDAQVWIGGSSFGPHGSMFVPPHHSRVPLAIDDLVRFARRTDVSALVHVAVAHAQFETIHPFPDGNGRTGRALIHAMLRRRRLVRNVTIPISAGLLVDTNSYFGALTSFRNGDPNPIVVQMTDAVFASIANARQLVSELDEVRETWQTLISARRDSQVWALLDLLLRQPAVTAQGAQRELDVSKPTIFSLIDTLESAGVLVKARGEERNRAWVATDVVAVLDRFAQRAGRRTRGTR
jgi:Fic family protein